MAFEDALADLAARVSCCGEGLRRWASRSATCFAFATPSAIRQGVVFNAHYLAYFDVGITELWRAAFGSYEAMIERGVDVVVAEAHLRFARSARFDDELTLEVVDHEARQHAASVSRHRIVRDDGAAGRGRRCAT